MCPSCHAKEIELTTKSEAEAEARVDSSRELSNRLLEESRRIDSQIKLKEDIFNSNTMAIVELEKAINADETVTDKTFTLCQELQNRYDNLSRVIFDARVMVEDAGNQQRAIQAYWNTKANQLRAEQREALKLKDINYVPDSIKVVKARAKSAAKGPKKGFKLSEYKEASAKYGIPMELIRSRTINKNETPEQAAKALLETMGG